MNNLISNYFIQYGPYGSYVRFIIPHTFADGIIVFSVTKNDMS